MKKELKAFAIEVSEGPVTLPFSQRRIADNEFCFQSFHFVLRLKIFFFHLNMFEEDSSCFLSHFKTRLVYGCKRGLKEFAKKPITKTYNSDVFGYSESSLFNGHDAPHSERVVGSKDGVRSVVHGN